MCNNYNKEKWNKIGILDNIPENEHDLICSKLNRVLDWLDDNSNNSNLDSDLEQLKINLIMSSVISTFRIFKEIDDDEVIRICGEISENINSLPSNPSPIDIWKETDMLYQYMKKKIEIRNNEIQEYINKNYK